MQATGYYGRYMVPSYGGYVYPGGAGGAYYYGMPVGNPGNSVLNYPVVVPVSTAAATRESEREVFYARLHAFRGEIGEPIVRLPTLGFKELDLFTLYKEVTKRKGIDAVIARKQWKEVAEALCLPSSCTDSGFRLRLHYKKYLEAFERKYFPQGRAHTLSAQHGPPAQHTLSDTSAVRSAPVPATPALSSGEESSGERVSAVSAGSLAPRAPKALIAKRKRSTVASMIASLREKDARRGRSPVAVQAQPGLEKGLAEVGGDEGETERVALSPRVSGSDADREGIVHETDACAQSMGGKDPCAPSKYAMSMCTEPASASGNCSASAHTESSEASAQTERAGKVDFSVLGTRALRRYAQAYGLCHETTEEGDRIVLEKCVASHFEGLPMPRERETETVLRFISAVRNGEVRSVGEEDGEVEREEEEDRQGCASVKRKRRGHGSGSEV